MINNYLKVSHKYRKVITKHFNWEAKRRAADDLKSIILIPMNLNTCETLSAWRTNTLWKRDRKVSDLSPMEVDIKKNI